MASDPFIVRRLFVSPGHNFVGHHGRVPSAHPIREVATVRCFAGRGIEGDRFLDNRPGNLGQITFFAEEVFTGLREALGIHDRSPAVLRRNVLVQGGDLNSLIGREFTVQGLRFRGTEECRPCYWMDHSFGLGAEAWLRQRGGLRAEILTDGVLRATSI